MKGRAVRHLVLLAVGCGGAVDDGDVGHVSHSRDIGASTVTLNEPTEPTEAQGSPADTPACELAATTSVDPQAPCWRDEAMDVYCLDPCPETAITCQIPDGPGLPALERGPAGCYYVARPGRDEHTYCCP